MERQIIRSGGIRKITHRTPSISSAAGDLAVSFSNPQQQISPIDSPTTRKRVTMKVPGSVTDDVFDEVSAIGESEHSRVTDLEWGALKISSKRNKKIGKDSRRPTIEDYPEVDMMIQELDKQVATLETMLESSKIFTAKINNNGNSIINNLIPPPQDEPTAVNMTSEQQQALSGLSSSIKGLIRCFNHRYNKLQDKILLALDDSDGKDDCSSTNDGSASKKQLLDEILGLEKNNEQGSLSGNTKQRKTVFSSNSGMRYTTSVNDDPSKSVSSIPQELIMGMMGESENEVSAFSAAYIAREYGGMELPQRFSVVKKKGPPTLKGFVASVSGANSFVRSLKKIAVGIGRGELGYLPQQFTRLGLVERKRLAELLRWDNLKVWGFNAFEIEMLSTTTQFRRGSGRKKSMIGRHELDTSKPNLGASDAISEGEGNQGLTTEKVDVESGEHGCPILLIGWALLASPYSQLAMAKNVNDPELFECALQAIKHRADTSYKGAMAKQMLSESLNEDTTDNNDSGIKASKSCDEPQSVNDDQGKKASGHCLTGGYFFPDEFEVSPRAICRFLRKVENEYPTRNVNPYHNNIHAADVIQTAHSLIQMGGIDLEMAYTTLEMYSILVSAACHDVRHPGTNNNYQVNKRTELSLIYNDNSVLENMHASRSSYLLEDINEVGGCGGDMVATGGMLGKMTNEQRKLFRESMIKSILSTDMSHHFSEMTKMARYVGALEDEMMEKLPMQPFLSCIGTDNHAKLRAKFLPFLLHLADISNAAKPRSVSLEWTAAVYDEFFLQGDMEAAQDMTISPLCDRATTNRPEAQVGFMNFVVKPAFALLARCIPEVESVVMRQLEENFKFWEEEKAKTIKDKKEEEDRFR